MESQSFISGGVGRGVSNFFFFFFSSFLIDVHYRMYRILDILSLTLSSRESILGHFKLKLLIFHYLRYIYLRKINLLIQGGYPIFFSFLIDVHYRMYLILDILCLTLSCRESSGFKIAI